MIFRQKSKRKDKFYRLDDYGSNTNNNNNDSNAHTANGSVTTNSSTTTKDTTTTTTTEKKEETNDQTMPPPSKLHDKKMSGIGRALADAAEAATNQNQRKNQQAQKPKPPPPKKPPGSRRDSKNNTPVISSRRRSSGQQKPITVEISDRYKGNVSRLLNDAEIQSLIQRLETMPAYYSPELIDNSSFRLDGNEQKDDNPMHSYNNKTWKQHIRAQSHYNQVEADMRLKEKRIQHLKDKDKEIEAFKKYQQENNSNDNANSSNSSINTNDRTNADFRHHGSYGMNMPLYKSGDAQKHDENRFEGLIIVSSLVCSAIRNCRKASCKLIALEILRGFGEFLSDHIRLDRIVPYIRAVIHDSEGKRRIKDEQSIVVAKAVEVMTDILSRVVHVPPKYARFFPDYVFDTIQQLVNDRREEIIRIEIARQLATLALTAKYFIDYRDKDRQITNQDNVDDVKIARQTASIDLEQLRNKVAKIFEPLFQDHYATVQRALLQNCVRLCEFLGSNKSQSHLFPLLFTFFNHKEWELRVAFLDIVVGISFYIGQEALHKVLLPCLEECLNDARPAVVERCLEAFTSLTELKIFDSELLLSRISRIAPLVCHYSAWVRNACVNFLLTAALILGEIRAHCRMLPLLEPYLMYQIVYLDRRSLTNSLKPPLNQKAFQLLITCAKSGNNEAMEKHFPELVNDQPLYDALQSYVLHVTNLSMQTINDEPDSANRRLYPKLYTIVVEPTVPVLIPTLPPMPQSVRVQQQHNLHGSNANDIDESDSQWQDLNHSINSIASSGRIIKNSKIKHDRHPRQVEDAKIREALELPPVEPFRQDKLITSQISTCGFYKNHAPPYVTHSVAWRPRGRVITQLTEHEDSVNVMKVSRDNLFVATGSSDASVKIWSCNKIADNANIKSEQTYSHQKGEIISLAILDSSHTIASGSREGSIHLFKVEYANQEFPPLVNKFTLDPEEGSVVTMEHFNTYWESLLVFGTHSGNIHGWDIRKKNSSFQLSMEPAMGSITAMVVGPTVHTVVVGTARGFIVVWDLRFEFPVQMWHHYDHSPIVSLTIVNSKTVLPHNKNLEHPTKGPLIIISTERSNELCCFDLNSGTCRIRFVMNAGKQTTEIPTPQAQTPANQSSKTAFKSITSTIGGMFGAKPSSTKSSHASYNYSTPTTPHGTHGASLGLKITQLPSVYPSALGQCPATSLFSNPSFEASITHTDSRFGNDHYGTYGNRHYRDYKNKGVGGVEENKSKNKTKNKNYKHEPSELRLSIDAYEAKDDNNDDDGGSGVFFDRSQKFSSTLRNHHSSTRRNGNYLYNCGFVPTVLNKGLHVYDIGNELESLCSNFGRERGGITGCLVSKDNFLLSAGRDRVLRYWDLQHPNKSFRISNTQPNVQFRYEAFKDKKYNEIVFQELIEFGMLKICVFFFALYSFYTSCVFFFSFFL